MGRKGGSNRLKRQMAPSFWQIKRKESRFVVPKQSRSTSKTKILRFGGTFARRTEGNKYITGSTEAT